MYDLINRFDLGAVKFNNQILACMIIIWLVVVGCVIASILSQQLARRQQLTWIALVAFLPVIGVLVYLPFSLKPDNSPEFLMWRRRQKNG
jgi:hypothetical protein